MRWTPFLAARCEKQILRYAQDDSVIGVAVFCGYSAALAGAQCTVWQVLSSVSAKEREQRLLLFCW